MLRDIAGFQTISLKDTSSSRITIVCANAGPRKHIVDVDFLQNWNSHKYFEIRFMLLYLKYFEPYQLKRSKLNIHLVIYYIK